MTQSVTEMINKYVAAWNENGLEEFKTAFAECWAADATYTDPNFELVKGVDGIAELAAASLKQLPVRTFRVVVQPEYHHSFGRYTWGVELPGKAREGDDFFEFNAEFKITRLVSFFKPLQ